MYVKFLSDDDATIFTFPNNFASFIAFVTMHRFRGKRQSDRLQGDYKDHAELQACSAAQK